MLSLPPSVRVFVATQPIDGRKGADSLMAIVRDLLGHDPLLCVVVRNVARGCSASGMAGPSAAVAQTDPPHCLQSEVLDFIEYLLSKAERDISRRESEVWSDLSLTSAMRGMEKEETPLYTVADLKAPF